MKGKNQIIRIISIKIRKNFQKNTRPNLNEINDKRYETRITSTILLQNIFVSIAERK